MTLSAKWIAEELFELLSEQEYEVHSTFENGFNLRVEDILCYIGNKYDMQLPYAIILEKNEVDKWNKISKSNEIEKFSYIKFKFRPENECLQSISQNVLIDLSKAVHYSSKLQIQVKEQCKVENACKILVNVLDKEKLRVELPIRTATNSFFEIFTSDDRDMIREVLKKIVGFGQGLTPSGDDFLMGIFLTYQLFDQPISTTFLQTLNDMLEHGYTTDTSVHYYRCAMKKMYSKPLLDLASALKETENEIEKMQFAKIALERLYTFGHTSGKDTAAGIRAACEYLNEKHLQR